MVASFRARRRLKIAPCRWREPGQPLPEAHTYFRLDSYLHTGYIESVEVSEDELRAAIDAFCPELSGQILSRVGIAARIGGPAGPDERSAAQRWAAELPVRVIGPAPRAARQARGPR